MRAIVLVLCLASMLNGCATTSSGQTILGREGSPAWFEKAPQRDVDSMLASKTLVQLRLMWDEAYNVPIKREAIARQLELRGKDPMMFWNNAADNESRTRNLESQMYHQQMQACIARGGSYGAGRCYGGN